ncbi:hypothetical protein H0H93_011144, partial [Arthromyces matolae]
CPLPSSSTNLLRDAIVLPKRSCVCDKAPAPLDVLIFPGPVITKVTLSICSCRPAPLQLLEHGAFASAPLKPTLAVDLKLLKLVTTLFLNQAPNHTAWCKTLETFLNDLGYKLKTEDSLRKRFSNALHWYNVLQDATMQHVDEVLTTTRHITVKLQDGQVISQEEEGINALVAPQEEEEPAEPVVSHVEVPPSSPSPPAHNRKRRRDSDIRDESPENPFPDALPRQRPSDYLRSRCPLCFGGDFPRTNHKDPDAIVCIDACFTQKRNHKARDPSHIHPRTLFVPESRAEEMENYVEGLRGAKDARPNKKPRVEADEEDDCIENPALLVPKSVLDSCEASFTAADARRTKASTQFFDDTALMALVCRHDLVLFLVNMRSAGEKQHYVITLIETLFQHLPLDFKMGIEYDIGCQTERSAVKWGFLDRYIDRISFAISVFHAFGHQWACQIIYHPRKREGFGLTDGEGCERFWHSISQLIPHLRVSGVSPL